MTAAGRAAARRVTIEDLMRQFGRRFWFGTIEVWDHVSHMAIRRGGASEPGLQVVITPDLAEMRDALSQDDSRAAGPPDTG